MLLPKFRKLDPDLFCIQIRENKMIPLILIRGKKDIVWGNSRKEKDEIVLEFDEKKHILLMPWPGKWEQHVFVLTQLDLAKHYIFNS